MTDDYEIVNRLPFDEDGQRAVVGWILKNREFAYKCKQHLNKDIFVTSILGEIFAGIVDFMKEYNDIPTKENLITLFSCRQVQDANKYKQEINDCIALSGNYNIFSLQKDITVWLQTAIFKQYSSKVAPHYKKANILLMQSMMKDALTKINEINFGKSANYQFGDPLQALRKAVNNQKTCVTTGVKEFDAAMGGGLYKGEATVVIAPISIGKSTFCLNMIYHNIMAGKKAIYVVHEGVPDELMIKLRQRFLKMTYPELLRLVDSASLEQLEELNALENVLKENLMFIPMLKAGGLYIEQVVDTIKGEQEKLFSKEGKYYDLIVSDYPQRLMTSSLSKNIETRNSTRYIYSEMQRLAMEFECHSICPLQTNREGFKSNKSREPGEYLDLDSASESFGVPSDYDNVLVLNRSDIDARNEVLLVHLAKTRRNKNKQILQFTTDYTRCITHDNELGCTVLTAGHKNTTLKSLVTQS